VKEETKTKARNGKKESKASRFPKPKPNILVPLWSRRVKRFPSMMMMVMIGVFVSQIIALPGCPLNLVVCFCSCTVHTGAPRV